MADLLAQDDRHDDKAKQPGQGQVSRAKSGGQVRQAKPPSLYHGPVENVAMAKQKPAKEPLLVRGIQGSGRVQADGAVGPGITAVESAKKKKRKEKEKKEEKKNNGWFLLPYSATS
jgi:hypothetical protein